MKDGVRPGSWFHTTECFGPVLADAGARTTSTRRSAGRTRTGFGLTGGLHSLDEAEIEHWLDRVEVGNAYVNRHITGAIVRRQPFGGWKASGGRAGSQGRRPELRRPARPLGRRRSD